MGSASPSSSSSSISTGPESIFQFQGLSDDYDMSLIDSKDLSYVPGIMEKLTATSRVVKEKDESAASIPPTEMEKMAKKFGDMGYIIKLLKEGIDFSGDKKVTYKLIISSIPEDENANSVIQYFTQLAGKYQSFGLTHAAIQLGGNLIEWNASSIVRIRPLGGRAIAAAVDLQLTPINVLPPAFSDDVLQRIATIIVNWNRSITYSRLKANCQHFVDEICSKGIGKQAYYSPAIKGYMDAIRLDPDNARPHYYDKSGRRAFFNSHAELDQYYRHNKPSLTNDQAALLKSFDRAYLIKWNHAKKLGKEKEHEHWKPEVETTPPPSDDMKMFGCAAFGPLTTKSKPKQPAQKTP